MNKQQNFIEKAKLVHNSYYDYSRVEYNGIKNKVVIICPIHGEFKQTPHHHIHRKQGCAKCGYSNISIKTRKSNEDFIETAKLVHGNKYDYSLAEYKNAKTKVKIICPIHGKFEQTPDNHIKGQICGKCIGLHKTTQEFINKAKLVHGSKYDYSQTDYKKRNEKIKIICPIHGEFEQVPYAHINLKQGCPKCVGLHKTTQEFINEAKLIHGDKYDYSLTKYLKSKMKISIICKKHGLFYQTPNMHLRGNGCPICKESKGEKAIRVFLIKHNIKYAQQHKFSQCKNKQVLPFDFYLPDYNTCIEYDGIQHYKPIKAFGGKKGFNLIKKNDLIKNNFCVTNKIRLIRIPYFSKVSDSLRSFFTK